MLALQHWSNISCGYLSFANVHSYRSHSESSRTLPV
jgi:hypothetical protein